MAARKRRKAAPEKSKAGRKKEIKRFELVQCTAEDTEQWNPEPNETAFIIRTSGGTPLNTTDTGKLYRLLQHELRALGHKLKRKGQELDPVEDKAEPPGPAPAPSSSLEDTEDEKRRDPDDESAAPDYGFSPKVATPPADPDDSDAQTDLPTPQ